MKARAGLGPAAAALVARLQADHAAVRRMQAKYNGRPADGSSLPRDVVEKVGLQLMAAYGVMRFFVDIDAKLASRVMSRAIRHLYASDIHWDASIAPGVMVVHGMGLCISHAARIEEGVLLFQHCTVGEGRHPDTHEVGAPTIERDAVIGAGATILGPVTIGARSKIMPGCVVVQSVPPDSIVEAPMPIVRSRRPAPGRRGDDPPREDER